MRFAGGHQSTAQNGEEKEAIETAIKRGQVNILGDHCCNCSEGRRFKSESVPFSPAQTQTRRDTHTGTCAHALHKEETENYPL